VVDARTDPSGLATASDAGSPTTLPSHSATTAGIHHAFRSQTGGLHQTEAASERAAVARKGIADLLEKAHLALQQRLGAADEPAAAEEAPRNGRTRIASTEDERPGQAIPRPLPASPSGLALDLLEQNVDVGPELPPRLLFRFG
jgi:hypothetical protein